MKPLFRNATTEDAEALIHHTKIILSETDYMLTTPEEYSTTVEKQEQWIKDHQKEGNLLLVVEIDGRVIGSLDFKKLTKKRIAHVGYFSISIQAEFCNKGIGGQLLTQLLEWAGTQIEIEKVCLEVFSHNKRAIKLYEKMGFKEEGRKVKFVKLASDLYVDEIEMYIFV